MGWFKKAFKDVKFDNRSWTLPINPASLALSPYRLQYNRKQKLKNIGEESKKTIFDI